MIEVDPLLSPDKVAELVGLKRQSLFDLSRAGRFPKPVRIASTRTAYLASEVKAWIDARVADRERGHDELRAKACHAVSFRGKKKAAGG
jgi:prophage regulatory protein